LGVPSQFLTPLIAPADQGELHHHDSLDVLQISDRFESRMGLQSISKQERDSKLGQGKMKRYLTAAAFMALSSATAFAADLPARTYTKAPPMVAAIYDWSGFYVGANAGGISSTADTSITNLAAPPATSYIGTQAINYPAIQSVGTQNRSSTGFLGGIQAGYNWQISNFLLGIESDIAWTDVKNTGSASAPYPVSSPPSSFSWGASVRQDFFATLRGRAGFTADRTLIYVTGGLAISEVKFGKTFTDNYLFPSGAFGQVSVNKLMTGWTIGIGVEQAITTNWTIKAEYLYADLGSISGTGLITHPSYPLYADSFTASAHITDNIFRVGANYKFGSR
jgi:outer membrane immunogenic protein